MKKVFLLFPMLFMLEIVLGESGRWMEIGGLSVRKTLFVLAMASLYGYAALYRERLRFGRVDAAVLFFVGVNTVWGFLIPLLYGRSLGLSFADFGAVYVLLLYFPLAALMRARALSWLRIRAIFLGTALLLAALHGVLWFFISLHPETVVGVREFLFGFFNTSEVYVGPMPDGFLRVMLVTSIFLLPAFFLLSGAVVEGSRSFVGMFLLFVVSCGLVVSYTRAFWVSVIFGLVLAWGISYSIKRLRGQDRWSGAARRSILPALTLVAAFALVAVAATILSPATAASGASPLDERITSTVNARDEGNNTKLEQLPYLMEEWAEAPLFGKGFGAYVEGYIRSEEAPFSYEMTAPALLMKLGIVGCALWLGPLIYVVVERLRRVGAKNRWGMSFAAAGFVAFGLAVQTNPLLFNFVGMVIVLLFLLELDLAEGNLADKVDA